MRKIRSISLSLLLVLVLSAEGAFAQFNKAYFYFVGRDFLIDNRYKEAIETLNILLRVDKNAYEGYFLRGIAKYNLEDLLGAEQDFSTAIEKNPVFTTAYQYRAITRSRLGNYDDALKDFQEAIDLRPDLPGPYYSRGVTYLLSQQFEKAIQDFNTFIRYENKVADAYINRGTAYLYLKDTTAAFDNYNQAIRTNREYPDGYLRRGTLYMAQNQYDLALEDFNKAISCDSTYIIPYFNRALVYEHQQQPALAIKDFDRVIEIDSTNSLTYFNRAIVRTQIGDYNRALDDYNKVALYSPDNVLVYFNRALLYSHLGELEAALQDYSKAIELYPDFANAYLNRAGIKYLLRDEEGAKQDRNIADKKIAEYQAKLSDSTFSIYADTSRRFNRLLSFDTKFTGSTFRKITGESTHITLRPLYKFTIERDTSVQRLDPERYYLDRVEQFLTEIKNPLLRLTNAESNIPTDSVLLIDNHIAEQLMRNPKDWESLFLRGITQSLIKQYTNSVNTYSTAIDQNPSNPFLYLNRSTTQAEMTDFISSIDNNYQRITIESDPVARLRNTTTRIFNYDDAIADLNKAIKLFPEFAHLYYNRGNLMALSGKYPEAYDDYSRAIELYPNFGDAYYNRGLVQIYMKDTRKGCLDISKAGELGVKEAYMTLQLYATDIDE